MLTCVYCYRFNVIGCRLLAVLLNVFKPCVSSQEPQNGPDRFPGRLVKKNDLKQALVLLCLVLLTLVVYTNCCSGFSVFFARVKWLAGKIVDLWYMKWDVKHYYSYTCLSVCVQHVCCFVSCYVAVTCYFTVLGLAVWNIYSVTDVRTKTNCMC